MTTLIVDLEADGLLPELTTIWQLSIIDADTGALVSYNDHDGPAHGRSLDTGLRRLAGADRLVFHHGLGYDLPAITKVYGDKYPLDWRKVCDTLVLSRLGNPERQGGHSLESWGERLEVPLAKVEHEDWTRWSFKMEHRCNTDARITLKVYKRLVGMYDAMPEAVAIEHAVAHEVMKTIRRGFRLDVEHCQTLISTFLCEQEALKEEFRRLFPPVLVPKSRSKPAKTLRTINKNHPMAGKLTPGEAYCPLDVEEFNPGSRQQIARRLISKYGWRPSHYTPSGMAEVSEDILRELPYEEAQRFADYLVVDKLLGQINAPIKADGRGGGWLHHVKADGRVHASLNPLKAVTGRLSCSAPNVQQASTDKRMRKAWIAAPGKVLVGVDAEGLELRCLAHYLWPLDGGAYAKMLLEGDKKVGTDVHSVATRLLCFHDRDETKRAEYGWLYGAGDAKLGLIAYQDAYKAGKDIDYAGLGIPVKGHRKPANGIVGKALRARLEEGITGLGPLVNGIRAKAKEAGKLRGLDGRTLWIRSEHSALNFLLQSAGIIIVKKAWTFICPELSTRGLVEDRDYGVVMQVHDEFQIEARPEVAEEVGKTVADSIVRAGRELGFRCPLAGDYKIGPTWADTH
jgi:DNA polymerase-1